MAAPPATHKGQACGLRITVRASDIDMVCGLLIPVLGNFAMLLRKRQRLVRGEPAKATATAAQPSA